MSMSVQSPDPGQFANQGARPRSLFQPLDASATLATGNAIREALERDGFFIFRSVLTREQVLSLRHAIGGHFHRNGRSAYGGKVENRGIYLVPALAQVLCCDPVIDVMHAVTAPLSPVMTGESFIAADTTSHWHKDISPDLGLGPEIFDTKDFAIFKLAFYLQDQDETSRSVLKVRKGSHLRREMAPDLPEVALSVRSGDVILFDVRIDHAGQMQSLGEKLLRRISQWRAKATGGDADAIYTRGRARVRARDIGNSHSRMAIFMTFGDKAPPIYTYELAGTEFHGARYAPIDPGAAAVLAARNVEVIRA